MIDILPSEDLVVLATARDSGVGQAIACVARQLQLDERMAAAWLAQRFGWMHVETQDLQSLEPALKILPLARAQQRHAVVMHAGSALPGWAYLSVVSDPFDAALQTQLDELVDGPARFALATAADIRAYLSQLESEVAALSPTQDETGSEEAPRQEIEVLSLAAATGAQGAAVRLLNSTLYDALRNGASDVHLEAVPGGMVIRFRIDGVLDTVAQSSSRALGEQAISRLKVLAELDIGERRVPQDGSFRVQALDRMIDLRVSIIPSVHGEDAVVRVLDKQAVIEAHGRLTLDALGFDPTSLRRLRQLIEAPYGMLLVTGPTGSGKTTTLYAALAETHTGRDKIVTIEDPVEYQLPGVLQVPVNEKKGLTFARGLRSILRHDPDKIMVGEIRDRETAEIAVQSSLTGHMVLSTVHANSVFDVFGRFTHMGLDPYALASALNGIWAQRLVRMTCPHCARPCEANPEQLTQLGLSPDALGGQRLLRGQGCGDCRGTGYRGRRAVAEILCLDDELRDMIVSKEPVRRLKEVARSRGTTPLLLAAIDVVRQGLTTLEEVRRVAMAG